MIAIVSHAMHGRMTPIFFIPKVHDGNDHFTPVPTALILDEHRIFNHILLDASTNFGTGAKTKLKVCTKQKGWIISIMYRCVSRMN